MGSIFLISNHTLLNKNGSSHVWVPASGHVSHALEPSVKRVRNSNRLREKRASSARRLAPSFVLRCVQGVQGGWRVQPCPCLIKPRWDSDSKSPQLHNIGARLLFQLAIWIKQIKKLHSNFFMPFSSLKSNVVNYFHWLFPCCSHNLGCVHFSHPSTVSAWKNRRSF